MLATRWRSAAASVRAANGRAGRDVWRRGLAPVGCLHLGDLYPVPVRPVGDSTDFGKGYSQPNATLGLCVNVLVRPTRISPRQSASQSGAGRSAAGLRTGSTLRGCAARPESSVTYCSQQRRPGRVPRFI